VYANKQVTKENDCKLSHTFKGHDSNKDMQAGENLSGGTLAIMSQNVLDQIVKVIGENLTFTPWSELKKGINDGVNGWGGEGYKQHK
jgi:hypothetical protein